MVEHHLLVSPGPKELEVVGLKEFLGATAPGIAHDIIDRSIQGAAERIARNHYEGPLLHKDRISVLSQEDAAEMLLGFLENARKVKESLRGAMDEEPEGESPWFDYLEIATEHHILNLPCRTKLVSRASRESI